MNESKPTAAEGSLPMQETGEGEEGKSEMQRAKEEEGMACSSPQITPGPVATRKEQEIGIRGEESGKM